MAKGHLQQLESQGRAYGDPLLASEVLERHCEEAEGATRDLERKRRAFLAVQAKVKVRGCQELFIVCITHK